MQNNLNFSIVLVAPEIPGNTGSIGRTCIALNIPLILIHPLGFNLDQKSVKRAGLDYWKHINLQEYQSFNHFMEEKGPKESDLFFFSSHGETSYFEGKFKREDHFYLIFGPESKGLDTIYFKDYPQRFFKIPILSKHVRSLNLSNAATTVSYEALRQCHAPFVSQLLNNSSTTFLPG